MDCDWMCLSVNGFEDSIVSWKKFEHGFEISGENDYKYIIFKDSSYWLFQILGQNDIYS
jgi:ribonucleases P/MRP protein subunit RPP40